MNDKFGNQINVGDIITYCAMTGDSTALRIGKVTKVDDRVFVRSVWENTWNSKRYTLFKKSTSLKYGDHIIILDPQKVPKQYMDLFDVVVVE